MNVILEKIEISAFGKLKGAVVTFEKGINILSAPNESGKSTLAAFIKFVFYGFAGTRAHTLAENERKLYTPWGGEAVSGAVTLVADGTRYTVSRICPPSGKESVEVINRSTGKAEFFGAVPGEVFFGVNEEIFARTLFFRQLTVPQSKDEILAERIQNIAISADEEVGTKKAVECLKDCKNELVGKAGKGIIPSLERERNSIEETLTASTDMRSESEKLRGEIKNRSERLEFNNEKLASLTAERENIEKYDALLKLQGINRLAVQEKNAREDYVKTSASLKKSIGNDGLAKLSAENAELLAERRNAQRIENEIKESESKLRVYEATLKINRLDDLERLKKIIKRAAFCFKLFLSMTLLLLVVSAAVFFVSKAAAYITMSCAAVCGVASIVFFVKKNPKKYRLDSRDEVLVGQEKELFEDHGDYITNLEVRINKLRAAQASAEAIKARLATLERELDISRDKVSKADERLRGIISEHIDSGELDAKGIVNYLSGDDIAENIEKIRLLNAEILQKQALYEAKKEELDNALLGIDLDALTKLAQGAVEPTRDRTVVDREISFYTQQNSQLTQLNRKAELDCASLDAKSGDPAVLVGKRDALEAKISELDLKHRGYETAIRFIEEASDYMKSTVAPRIGARADEYFNAATGGKYRGLEIDTRLSMSVGEDFRRSCDYLSSGTRDSAYLSLRLALADMLFDGCGVPMLLDDAFVRIDDDRLRLMSCALVKAALKHQIIILTHGSRERDALFAANAEFNEISIKTV